MCRWLHVWISEDNLWEPILLLVGDLGINDTLYSLWVFFLTNYTFRLGHQYIILRNRQHLTRHTPFWCWIIAQAEDSLYFPNAKSDSVQSKTGSSMLPARALHAQLNNRGHTLHFDKVHRPFGEALVLRSRDEMQAWMRTVHAKPLWDTVLLWQLAGLTSLLLESLIYRCVSPHPV